MRRVVARHPLVYWCAVGVLAAGLAGSVLGSRSRIDAAARAWGRTVPVWVTTAPVGAGRPVLAERREYPAAMVPPSAADRIGDGAVAAHALASGEVITDSDIVDGSVGLVPAGWLVVALPAPDLGVDAGDRVRLFSFGSVLTDGVVLMRGDDHVEVGLPADRAGQVTAAAVAGDLSVALVAGP
jgi:hypothetical protein